jgi:hypothetical protein
MARVRAQEKRLLVGFVADSEQPNAPINCLEGIAYRAKPDSSASYRGIDSVDRGPFVNEAGCEQDGLGLDFAARVKRRETFRRTPPQRFDASRFNYRAEAFGLLAQPREQIAAWNALETREVMACRNESGTARAVVNGECPSPVTREVVGCGQSRGAPCYDQAIQHFSMNGGVLAFVHTPRPLRFTQAMRIAI